MVAQANNLTVPAIILIVSCASLVARAVRSKETSAVTTISAFPRGRPGLGLLLLRLVIGLLAFMHGMLYLSNPGGLTPTTTVLGALVAVSGVMLMLGFLTPAVGIVIGLVMTGTALSWLPSGTR